MVVTVIGLGLIGGSIALKLKKEKFASKIIGIDINLEHAQKAYELGIVDEFSALNIEEILKENSITKDTIMKKVALTINAEKSNLVILAIPVNETKKLLPLLLNLLNDNTVIVDVGSTKNSICKAVTNNSKREQYVASHPIAGTENTGPSAAFDSLFDNKISIICEKDRSKPEALHLVEKMYKTLGMKLAYIESPTEHDFHIAYVSHLSHISSFTLGLTVLEEEKNEKNIFNMAGSGFTSTVRLAKSSPEMWSPIFNDNAENISKALGSYIEKLKEFKAVIDNKDTAKAKELMREANDIRRILNGIELRENKN